MRISDSQRYRLSDNRVNHAKNNNSYLHEQISTQKRINRVSDDPVSLGRVIKNKASLNDLNQFQKNIEFSKGYIERSESSLKGIIDFLIRAKELSVSMASDTYGPDSRDAASREIKEIVEGVVGLANTQYGGRYVFGGFRSQTPPLSGDGNFLGDDGAIFLQVDHGNFKQINLQARELFEPNVDERQKGHLGLVPTLQILKTALEDNDMQSIRKAMEELDYQLEKASTSQSTLGGVFNGVQSTLNRLEISDEITTKEISRLEDADTFKVISDFKRTEDVLQSTLMASNKLLQPSLLNFMQ